MVSGNLWRCCNCNLNFYSDLTLRYCPCCGESLSWHGAQGISEDTALQKGYRQILWKRERWIKIQGYPMELRVEAVQSPTPTPEEE